MALARHIAIGIVKYETDKGGTLERQRAWRDGLCAPMRVA